MLRILYVEDNAANLSLVHRVARIGGHEVVNRTSGEAALKDFDSIRPDMVLMDIQLEGVLTGLDVVKTLREQGKTLPIVAVTAYAMKGDREKALEAGCNAYLAKPLPIKELIELINQYQTQIEQRKTGEAVAVPSAPATTENKAVPSAPVTTEKPSETPATSVQTKTPSETVEATENKETPSQPAPSAKVESDETQTAKTPPSAPSTESVVASTLKNEDKTSSEETPSK